MVLVPRLLNALVVTAAVAALGCDVTRTVEAGFWFDEVTFTANVLGGAVTAEDLRVIEATARAELAKAFRGLDVSISDRRDVRYHVRVVQELLDRRLRHRKAWIAGQSSAARLTSSRTSFSPQRRFTTVEIAGVTNSIPRPGRSNISARCGGTWQGRCWPQNMATGPPIEHRLNTD